MEDSAYIHDKVVAIFEELAPGRRERLSFFEGHAEASEQIENALRADFGTSAADLAFHLSDFRVDAAFLVALHLFPERFSPKEVSAGIYQFLAHAPYHIDRVFEIMNRPDEA